MKILAVGAHLDDIEIACGGTLAKAIENGHEVKVLIMSKSGYTNINGEVQRELSRIISREIKDPRIAPMTSVVDAVVTSDLKQCKAYISVLGNDEEKEETMKGLNSAVGYIRRELAHSINLRNTP